MLNETNHFKNTTLLVTHYNRSRSLENLLSSFKKINCSFEEIIVSDDGSQPEHIDHLQQLQQRFNFRLITTPINKGLGNNINKGQDAVSQPYTLYVQEDFKPATDFAFHFQHALDIINERKDIDLIRFYAYFMYPFLKDYKYGFAEMQFNWWRPGYKKFYCYSDHPHLRRSDFLRKFGRYTEDVKGDVTEYEMMMSFIRNKGKGMFYKEYKNMFHQRNSTEEPSTMKRNIWRESHNFFIHLLRESYRHFKFNRDLLLK